MLKIVFAATPKLACPSLEALHQLTTSHISALLTQPDQPAGRKRLLQPSAVKSKALELGLKNILTPAKLDKLVRQQIAEMQPDLLVVFAYGKIFRQVFLDLFPLGGINLHPSALPQWRGPSPIEAQLLAGVEQLGISVQRISLELDAGDILQQEFYTLPVAANYFAAAQIAAQQGAALLRRSCQKIATQGRNYLDTAKPQAHELASYCHRICKDDGRLDWNHSALQLSRQCRAYAAWPRAYTWLAWKSAQIFQVHILEAQVWQANDAGDRAVLQQWLQQSRAQPGSLLALHSSDGLLVLTGAGILAIRQLQRQSKNACSAKEFANQLPNDQCYLPRYGRLGTLSPMRLYQRLYRFETAL